MCYSLSVALWSCCLVYVFFFFKQKTAYEMRISDWSSDVCSSDLQARELRRIAAGGDEGVILAEKGVESAKAGEAPGIVERRQIGSHLFLRQHSIVAGQAARRKESVIGVQRRHIVGIDRQPRADRKRPRLNSSH